MSSALGGAQGSPFYLRRPPVRVHGLVALAFFGAGLGVGLAQARGLGPGAGSMSPAPSVGRRSS